MDSISADYNPMQSKRQRLEFDEKRLSPFPLFELNDTNLVKVLQKIQSRSFRRIQQTTWDMWGYVQRNSKVSVFTEGKFFLNVQRDAEDPEKLFCFGHEQYGSSVKVDAKGLYASRLASLKISNVNTLLTQRLLDFVQRYRITCDELIFHDIKWEQKEQYEELLKVLKPVSVTQISGAFDLYEALHSSEILKNVSIVVRFDSAEMVAMKLLAKYEKLVITVAYGFRSDKIQLQLFKRILQILFSESRPKLQNFSFVLNTELNRLQSSVKLREDLRNFDLERIETTGEKTEAHFNLPREDYPLGSRCVLTLKCRRRRRLGVDVPAGDILFKRGPVPNKFKNEPVLELTARRLNSLSTCLLASIMSGFPLFDLEPHLLEKVIRQLEGKSYIRMQQTCKDLKKFMGKIRKLSIFFDGRFQIDMIRQPNRPEDGQNNDYPRFSPAIILQSEKREEIKKINIESLFDARLSSLWIPSRIPVQPFCDTVRSVRITCHFLTIWKTPMDKWHLKNLLNILKPRQINFHCYKSTNNFEALWESETLRKVHVCLDPPVVVNAVPHILAALEDVKLRVGICTIAQYPMIQAVLQIFLSKPWPNLRRFEFSVGWSMPNFLDEEELRLFFPGIRLTRVAGPDARRVYDLEDLPEYISPESLCQLTLADSEQGGCRIRYIR